MACEEQSYAVRRTLSSDCDSGWFHQHGDGDDGDDDVVKESLRCLLCVLAYRSVRLGGDDDG